MRDIFLHTSRGAFIRCGNKKLFPNPNLPDRPRLALVLFFLFTITSFALVYSISGVEFSRFFAARLYGREGN